MATNTIKKRNYIQNVIIPKLEAIEKEAIKLCSEQLIYDFQTLRYREKEAWSKIESMCDKPKWRGVKVIAWNSEVVFFELLGYLQIAKRTQYDDVINLIRELRNFR